jgi:hypothetical protein
MGLRAYLLTLGLSGLLSAAQATFGHAAPWCAGCAGDPQTSDAGYYDYGNQHCRVTMSGLGVCVRSKPARFVAPSRCLQRAPLLIGGLSAAVQAATICL